MLSIGYKFYQVPGSQSFSNLSMAQAPGYKEIILSGDSLFKSEKPVLVYPVWSCNE